MDLKGGLCCMEDVILYCTCKILCSESGTVGLVDDTVVTDSEEEACLSYGCGCACV